MKHAIARWCWLLLLFPAAQSQIVTTAAGTDFTFPTGNITALNAPLGTVGDVILDNAGNLYIADSDNNLILRVVPGGATTVVAGNGIAGYSGDGGPATAAALSDPAAIALDSAGNLYIADTHNSAIRMVSNGIIRTIAGTGEFAYSGDGGLATNAGIGLPAGIAIDAGGNIYFSDVYYNVVRKITNGIITRFAGKPENPGGFSGDNGPATSAEFSEPYGLAFDSAGNLYISDSHNDVIRKVSNGTITTIAGSAGNYGDTGDNGPAAAASLGGPQGIGFDSAGNLYIADNGEYVIRKISTTGIITTVAGNNMRGFSGDGTQPLRAKIYPGGVAVDPLGNIYIADSSNYRVRKVTGAGPGATINTFAGNGNFRFGGDGGFATSANMNAPQLIALASNGDYYIADNLGNRVRKVSNGIITTVAGSGAEGFLGDNGPAVKASLDNPNGVAVDSLGNIYIADIANNRIREVSNGVITTIAGSATEFGYNGDGIPAATAALNNPSAVALDAAGNLYIADQSNNRIRKISNGIITTVVGNGAYGYSGDGGAATSAMIQNVSGLAFDSAGNLYFSDFDYHGGNYIRKLSNGVVTTIAGSGASGYSGDGESAVGAQLEYPSGVAVDSAGNVYVADTHNSVIRKISGGMITTFAGTGDTGLGGDGGPAAAATLNQPFGVAVDAAGNVYISDTGNSRIREVLAKPPVFADPVAAGGLTISLSQASGGKPVTATVTVDATTTVGSSAAVPGMQYTAAIRSGGSWLSISPADGNTPGLLTITADPLTLAPGNYFGAIDLTVPAANPPLQTVTVMFNVGTGIPAAVMVDQTHMSFTYATTSVARSQTLIVSNSGGGSLNFTASIVLNSGVSANWLSVTPQSGTATPGSPAALTVIADPSMLSAGTYTGSLTINGGSAGSVTLPITITITPNPLVMLLSQTGLTFTAVRNGGVIPPQTFGVLSLGSGTLNWSVQMSTVPAGGAWLIATPDSGSSNAGASAPTVTVSVNPAGLQPGVYYGLITVVSAGAANTPQQVVAVLNVLPPGADVAPIIQPSSLIFTAPTGGSSPSSQLVTVYDPTGTGKSFRSGTITTNVGLAILPTDATIAPTEPTRIVVQPFLNGLAPGNYNGTITLQFSDGRVGTVGVVFVVTGAPSTAAGNQRVTTRDSGSSVCTPAKLIPVLTTLSPAFSVNAGYPTALSAQVMDDCGNPQTSGHVTVSFTNGDPPVGLTSLNNGTWQATWYAGPQSAGKPVKLTVMAVEPQPQISGTADVEGGIGATQLQPMIMPGGVVSAAGPVSFTPLAPGGIISIYGNLLADGALPAPANQFPLPTMLGSASVIIAGQTVPLFYASPGQINAVVPFGLNTNTAYSVLVQRDQALSSPVSFDIADAQPAAFLSGGNAIIQDYRGTAAPFLVTPAAPAQAGDTLVIYCAGLGITDQTVADGAASPGSPPARVQSFVTVSIGGRNAPVSFAGLTPTLVGLYQINVVMPAGVTPGSSVPVILTVAGQASPAAIIATQ